MSDEIEMKCDTCNGTGFQVVMQPVQPGKKIYPLTLQEVRGQGRNKKGRQLMALPFQKLRMFGKYSPVGRSLRGGLCLYAALSFS
jgi:hypothetical protein